MVKLNRANVCKLGLIAVLHVKMYLISPPLTNVYLYLNHLPFLHSTSSVVYTPQRKSARRLTDEEIIYDDEKVSQILLNDPNSAFISNPVRCKKVFI